MDNTQVEQYVELNELLDKINSLEEFLFDDYGDSVAQLGQERCDELEVELNTMRQRRSELLKL